MRKVTFGGANSLDNFIARKDDSFDWITFSDEVTEIMKDYWATIDTVVMGRRTYEVTLKHAADVDTSALPKIKTYVFSRTLKNSDTKDVEIISEDAADFVRKLKNKAGKDICVLGGGVLARSLFEADLIDEIGLSVHPVLLGSGIPLFHEMTKQIDLELVKCQELKNGCVVLTYRVKH